MTQMGDDRARNWWQMGGYLRECQTGEIMLRRTAVIGAAIVGAGLPVMTTRAHADEAWACSQTFVECMDTKDYARHFFDKAADSEGRRRDEVFVTREANKQCNDAQRNGPNAGKFCFSFDARYSAQLRDYLRNSNGNFTIY